MSTHTQTRTANPSPTATYEYLLAHYGPLLTLKHLAEVLHSTPAGVRMNLVRRRQPLSIALAQARRRLGRRVFFDARGVAQAIDAQSDGIAADGGPLGPGDGSPPDSLARPWTFPRSRSGSGR
jgi:hypothetical protein